MVTLRETEAGDVERLLDVVRRTAVFSPEEVGVAAELLEEATCRRESTTYRSITALADGRVAGYILFGPTPMTLGTWDLYWMAVEPSLQGRGIGAGLVRAMEDRIRAEGGRLVRVETSGLPEYAPTRAFYERVGYPESSRVQDFYWPGNALCTHVKALSPEPGGAR